MTPGNHDGFFYGNTAAHKNRLIREDYWDKACENAGEQMTKDKFVSYYMAALLLQDKDQFSDHDIIEKAQKMLPRGECRYSSAGNGGRSVRIKCEFRDESKGRYSSEEFGRRPFLR